MPRGEALDEQGERGLVGQAVGHWEHAPGRGDGQLRVAAGVQQRHHALAVHRSRNLSAEHERHLALGHVLALALVGVAEVHARARDAHEQLAIPGLRVGDLGHRQHLGPPELLDHHGLHARHATFVRVRRLAMLTIAVSLLGAETASAAKVTRVASNLRVPWGIDFLPGKNGDALVAERTTGRIVRISRPGGRKRVVMRIPGVDTGAGEGGLLGLAVSPNYSRDRLVYAYFTSAQRQPDRALPARRPGEPGAHGDASASPCTTAGGWSSAATASSTPASATPATARSRRAATRSTARSCA